MQLIFKIDQEIQSLNLPISVEGYFKGEFENKITSKTCNLEKTITEDFIMIPVSIQKLKNLDESLERFFMGEILTDENRCYCEQCNIKHDVQLKKGLKKLPNQLLFEIKRMELDFIIMDFLLIDSYHELPNTLNLHSYMKNDHSVFALKEEEKKRIEEEKEDYKYRLSGLVIYQGTEKAGKYCSLIRDREVQQKWYKIDRDGKKEFDHDDIPKLAFGNEKGKVESWAHLVIYDKIQTSNFHIHEREP